MGKGVDMAELMVITGSTAVIGLWVVVGMIMGLEMFEMIKDMRGFR